MLEKIYTIPINEAFDACQNDKSCGCPLCRIYNKLEYDELDIILGAAMMNPETRIQTNEKGFCAEHFDMMLHFKNRLGLALMLESHLDEINSHFKDDPVSSLIKGAGSGTVERIKKLGHSCYLCDRISDSFSKMIENTVYLWESEPDFSEKLKNQPYFCLPHFEMLLASAKAYLPKKRYNEFYKDTSAVVNAYFGSLRADVSLFCKKFDYRYENEPWGNAKDSIERSLKFLGGDLHDLPDKPRT